MIFYCVVSNEKRETRKKKKFASNFLILLFHLFVLDVLLKTLPSQLCHSFHLTLLVLFFHSLSPSISPFFSTSLSLPLFLSLSLSPTLSLKPYLSLHLSPSFPLFSFSLFCLFSLFLSHSTSFYFPFLLLEFSLHFVFYFNP
jgi:hypothetical protein